jgi:hypothetical protein
MYFSIGNMLENESQQLPIVPNDQIKRKQMPFWSTPKGFYNWNIKKKKERKKQGDNMHLIVTLETSWISFENTLSKYFKTTHFVPSVIQKRCGMYFSFFFK